MPVPPLSWLTVRIIVLKNTEKGSIFVFFVCHWYWKKGSFLKKKVSGLQKKGLFFRHFHWERVIVWCSMSEFLKKKGSFLPFVYVSERGMFLFWRTIIRPPFWMWMAGPGWPYSWRVFWNCHQIGVATGKVIYMQGTTMLTSWGVKLLQTFPAISHFPK